MNVRSEDKWFKYQGGLNKELLEWDKEVLINGVLVFEWIENEEVFSTVIYIFLGLKRIGLIN